MTCNNCNNIVPEGATFCPYCGSQIITNNYQSNPVNNVTPNVVPKKNKKTLYMVIAVLGVIVVGLGGYLLFGNKESKNEKSSVFNCTTDKCYNFTMYFIEGTNTGIGKAKETYKVNAGTKFDVDTLISELNKSFGSKIFSSDGSHFYINMMGMQVECAWYYKGTNTLYDWTKPVNEDVEIEMKMFNGLLDNDDILDIDDIINGDHNDNNYEDNSQEINTELEDYDTFDSKYILKQEEYDVNKPIKFVVEDVFTIAGRGTVATGTIINGKIEPNTSLKIYGFGKNGTEILVSNIEKFKTDVESASAGETVGLFIDLHRSEIKPGMIFAAEEYKTYKSFDAKAIIFKDPAITIYNNSTISFYFNTAKMDTNILLKNVDSATSGDVFEFSANLEKDVVLNVGDVIQMYFESQTIGRCVITNVR